MDNTTLLNTETIHIHHTPHIDSFTPFKCAAENCPNVYVNEPETCEYLFFHFPEDKTQRRQWLEYCNWPAKTPITATTKICSVHFPKSDFDAITNELRPTAVPCVQETVVSENTVVICNSEEEINPVLEENQELQLRRQSLMEEYDKLQRKLGRIARLKANRQKLIKKYRGMIKSLPKRSITEKSKVLTKIFSESQINVLMGEKDVVWSEDDLARAFTMRHMGGKECYLYMKNTLKLPLPSLACIQKWIASCNTNNVEIS